MTTALEGGEGSASRPGRSLTPEKKSRYPLYRRFCASNVHLLHMCTKFDYERPTSPLDDLRVDERIILKWIFTKWHGGAWTGLIRFGIEKSGGLL